MTAITSNHDRLVAKGRESLAELKDILSNKITILGELKQGRGGEEHARLSAKIRGIEAGLRIAESPEAESAFSAYWVMVKLRATTPDNERAGLEIAIQDAMLISRL